MRWALLALLAVLAWGVAEAQTAQPSGKRPPFRKVCLYDPDYTIVDHLNRLSTFDAAEVKVLNGHCIITRY
jgi:hypothetical protein